MIGTLRLFLLGIFGIVLPLLPKKPQTIKKIPSFVAVFGYGYSICLFLEYLWTDGIMICNTSGCEIQLMLYPMYPESTIPCTIMLLFLSVIQFLFYIITECGWYIRRMSSDIFGDVIIFKVVGVGLTIGSIILLSLPAAIWR